MIATAIWRRLDTPGHDAAVLHRLGKGWRLEGSAVFLHETQPAQLAYELDLEATWETRRAEVRGFIGDTVIDDTITREDGKWAFNGESVGDVDSLVDLDLAFTPATNLQQLRRMDLKPGETADLPVAWLEPGARTLVVLPQRYRRQDELTYWYDAPSVPYQAVLEIAPSGFVRSYPKLWVLEAG